MNSMRSKQSIANEKVWKRFSKRQRIKRARNAARAKQRQMTSKQKTQHALLMVAAKKKKNENRK